MNKLTLRKNEDIPLCKSMLVITACSAYLSLGKEYKFFIYDAQRKEFCFFLYYGRKCWMGRNHDFIMSYADVKKYENHDF